MPKVLKDFIASLNAEDLKEVYIFLDTTPSAMEDIIDAITVRGNELGIQ